MIRHILFTNKKETKDALVCKTNYPELYENKAWRVLVGGSLVETFSTMNKAIKKANEIVEEK